MERGTHPPEDLTEEQYEKLAPLLKLADLCRPEKLAESLKPAEVRRRELKDRFLTALREHGTITHASAAAGIGRNTAWRWMRDDQEFADEVNRWLHEDQVNELHESMYRIATSTDPKTASAAVKAGEFLLKALDRDTYGDQIKQDTTLTINGQVQIVHQVRDEMRAQQEARLAALRGRTIDALPEGEQ